MLPLNVFCVLFVLVLCGILQVDVTSRVNYKSSSSASFRELRKIWKRIKPAPKETTGIRRAPTFALLNSDIRQIADRLGHRMLDTPMTERTERSELDYDFVHEYNEAINGMDLSEEIGDILNITERVYNEKKKKLDLSHGGVRGVPITAILRAIQRHRCFREIEDLRLSHNRIFGIIQMDALPPNLKYLDISNNDLYSLKNSFLSILPKSLLHFYAQNNHFADDRFFAWYLLPSSIRILSLRNNDFEGEIRWRSLPKSLKILIVSKRVGSKSMYSKPLYWIDAVGVPLYRAYLVEDNSLDVVENTAMFVNNDADGFKI